MDSNRFRLMHLLEMLSDNEKLSQRDLSRSLDISLGMVNAFIRQLVNKDYCKVKSLPSKRLRYILTPSGVLEKTRLVYEYISISYAHFKEARHRLSQFFLALEEEGITRIVFCGRGELCDVAMLVLSDTNLRLIAIVDDAGSDETCSKASAAVKPLSRLSRNDFDIVLITAADGHSEMVDSIHSNGVPKERIRFID